MATTLQLRANARPDCIRVIRNMVAAFASEEGLPEAEVYAIKMSVSEAVTNAVKHAYPEGETGSVEVSLRELGDELEIVVADHGKPHLEGRSGGESGFGLAFVSRLADRCTFVAEGDGTVVEMLFPLRHPEHAQAASAVRLRLDRESLLLGPGDLP